MSNRENDRKSRMMFITSMLIFGTIGIFRRYIPIPSSLLAFVRGLMGAGFLIALVKIKKKPLNFSFGKRKIIGFVITGALMSFNWILLFEAYNYTTIATATLCYYMQPTIVILLSPFIFNEKLTIKKALCAFISILGMLFVSGMMENGIPKLEEIRGILCGLGAASLYASVVIMNKKMPGVGAYEKTIIQLSAAAVVLVPYLIFTDSFSSLCISRSIVFMLLLVGLVHTGIAYALYFGSMDGLKAQSIAAFSYIDPISALVLSMIFLHEMMTPYGIVGTILILGATAVSELVNNNN